LAKIRHVPKEQKLPVVLSREEVALIIESAPNLKMKTALRLAYGAGLRAGEVVALKTADVDSQRMTLRIEQAKGRKDRYAILSPLMLQRLRAWWRHAKSQNMVIDSGWLFPGMNRLNPLSTRQLNRGFHDAARAAASRNASACTACATMSRSGLCRLIFGDCVRTPREGLLPNHRCLDTSFREPEARCARRSFRCRLLSCSEHARRQHRLRPPARANLVIPYRRASPSPLLRLNGRYRLKRPSSCGQTAMSQEPRGIAQRQSSCAPSFLSSRCSVSP
jgi:hypothetical protein